MEVIGMAGPRGSAAAGQGVAGLKECRPCLPSIPPAPDEVRAAIEKGVRSRKLLFPENGPARTVEVWQAPAIEDKKVGQAIWSRLKLLDGVLEPAGHGELMSRVLVLLSHYRVSANADTVEQGVADDWAEDLGHYPMWAVDEAARRWRQTRKFKPQICEIAELCDDACREAAQERSRLQAMVDAMNAARNPLAGRMRDVARNAFRTIGGGREDERDCREAGPAWGRK